MYFATGRSPSFNAEIASGFVQPSVFPPQFKRPRLEDPAPWVQLRALCGARCAALRDLRSAVLRGDKPRCHQPSAVGERPVDQRADQRLCFGLVVVVTKLLALEFVPLRCWAGASVLGHTTPPDSARHVVATGRRCVPTPPELTNLFVVRLMRP